MVAVCRTGNRRAGTEVGATAGYLTGLVRSDGDLDEGVLGR